MMGFRRDEAITQRRIDRVVIRRGDLHPAVPAAADRVRRLGDPRIDRHRGHAAAPEGLIDTAIPHHDRTLVMWIALTAVGLALSNAALSLVQRYYSARIGEGLIYDLRVALFDHVQRMPIAFFTRTQTGALQSRLNNDVVGAQQAVTNTLGTVLQNFIQLVVTLAIMFQLSWQITLLTLLALPAFIYPARLLGPRIQKLARVGMQQNAEMNNITAERFNVAGAMLAKLFGRPDRERDAFSARREACATSASRPRSTAGSCSSRSGLVTAIGTAIVYWIGGNLAVSGTITSGARSPRSRRTSR